MNTDVLIFAKELVIELEDRIIKIEDDMHEFKKRDMLYEYNVCVHIHEGLISYHNWIVERVIEWN